MGHLEGNLHRELYVTGEHFVFVPRHLVDQLLHAVLLDGVGVDVVVLQHRHQFAACWLGMAVQQVGANQRLAVAGECGDGFIAHFQYLAVFVADGDGDRCFLEVL